MTEEPLYIVLCNVNECGFIGNFKMAFDFYDRACKKYELVMLCEIIFRYRNGEFSDGTKD